MTQSAVSRQIRALEDQLAVSLFMRQGRRVRLTETGRVYRDEITAALGKIRGATLQAMAQNAGHRILHLACLPTLASIWLLPRLPAFYAKHPDITIHLHSRIAPVDFERDSPDAAITVGSERPSADVARHLWEESLIAIGASKLDVPHNLTDRWIAAQPLLGVPNNLQAWTNWFGFQGLTHAHMRLGPSFELTSHLIQAVQADLGLGLVPRILVADEIARRRLQPVGQPIPSARCYRLIYPERNAGQHALSQFEAWLLSYVTPA